MKIASQSMPFKQFILLGILISTFVVLYMPALSRLVRVWSRSEDYSHGFFIIPLCLFLIWQKRETLRRTPIRQSKWGLVLTFVALAVYVLAEFAGILTLSSASIIPAIMGSVLFLFGPHILKEILFPLCFLIFMVPVPAQIFAAVTFPLQLLVSKISSGIAQAMAVPVYREGNVIYLPEHTLQVVQACSGLRSMISLLTLSAVLSYLTLRANLLRAMLFVSGTPVAIMVNIVRVLTMILAFHYFNYDLTRGTVHTVFGVVIFFLAIFFLLALKGIFSKWDTSSETQS